MSETVPKKKWGCLARMAVTVALVGVLVAVGLFVWVQSLPEPDWEKYQAAANQNESARAALGRMGERRSGIARTGGAIPGHEEQRWGALSEEEWEKAAAGMTAEERAAAASARATAMFAEIMTAAELSIHASEYFLFKTLNDAFPDDLHRTAMQMAQLYDSGGRVAEAWRREFPLWQERGLEMILHRPGYAPWESTNLYDDEWVDQQKFRRVVGVPTGQNLELTVLPHHLELPDQLPEQAKANLDRIEPEWLAERGPVDCTLELDRMLEYLAQQRQAYERMLAPLQAYPVYRKNFTPQYGWDDWGLRAQRAIAPVTAAGYSFFGSRLMVTPVLAKVAEAENTLNEYVACLEAGGRPNAASVKRIHAVMQRPYVDLFRGRVLAAAIEMRRGGAAPAAGSIGPESWLWDPVAQRPYLLARTTREGGRVTVYIYREVDGWRQKLGAVDLPAGQAGVESLQEVSGGLRGFEEGKGFFDTEVY